ncbi:2143_t:CDS:1 [Paraglomus brasilianum]|uniref:2143_t:CDS:1 n=1 Tax=Paraglomus brasilianum TaxID=144538 RepID=A0A9N9AF78_9GLOM|nr:2143_t:CDS:1 [Paraglomus brasilianum]
MQPNPQGQLNLPEQVIKTPTRLYLNCSSTQYLRYLVHVILKLKGVYEEIPNNIIDETVDEAIKNYNQKDIKIQVEEGSRAYHQHPIAKFFEKGLESLVPTQPIDAHAKKETLHYHTKQERSTTFTFRNPTKT